VAVSDSTQSPSGIDGIPLLVVEILFSATRTQDRAIKSRRYAELRIPHHWIGDPDTQRLHCLRLERIGSTKGLAATLE
jgi:Uma2 family endonuclease